LGADPTRREVKKMIQTIESLIQVYPAAAVAVAFHDQVTGARLLIRPDQPFHPASTIKIAIMMEVFHQVQQGLLALDEQLPITNVFVSIADGSLFSMLPDDDSELTLYRRMGRTASLRELLRLMITVSSNFATNLLVRRVSARCVTEFMRSLGVPEVIVLRGPEDSQAFARDLNNSATASGLMRLLSALAAGQVVSPQASTDMIELLLGQKYNEGIPAGLPPGLPVAHKTGWNAHLYHDAAIVFPEGRKPYVLVVMTRGIQYDRDAHALVAAISRACYQSIVADQLT
jgi:beta-lactamase class A